jgi:TLD
MYTTFATTTTTMSTSAVDNNGSARQSTKECPLKTQNDAARKTLSGQLRTVIGSLTEPEVFFLHALLDDNECAPSNEKTATLETHTMKLHKASEKLSDELLFSTTKSAAADTAERNLSAAAKPWHLPIHDLWQAHQDGVHPKQLASKGSRNVSLTETTPSNAQITTNCKAPAKEGSSSSLHLENSSGSRTPRLKDSSNHDESENQEEDDIASDAEVRPEAASKDDADGSSWGSQDDANHLRYDAWEVLKDEYAADFGFNFTAPGTTNSDDEFALPNSFQILGTSADDKSAQPHVMSPPMMDALMSFLPEKLVGQNFWLRFSLARDGASLDTLKRYVRAAEYTILAIETHTGQVFGCFTSSPWRNNFGFYGSTPAFVWKMRHSRRTKCTSLFDQAQLESEIDVFVAAESRDKIQVCRHNSMAVGGDEFLLLNIEEHDALHEAVKPTDRSGFAICLESDLLRGTTSQCATFHNPSLCGSGKSYEVFEVAGLEVWSLTPCYDVKAAERLEMSKFFVEESVRSFAIPATPNNSTRTAFPSTPYNSTRSSSVFSADLDQDSFYRRVGHDPDGEARRDRWSYMNMMNVEGKANVGLGASPRYGYEKKD